MPDLDDLPDLVINKILNVLPTKAAIQATFLSKQFRPIYSASALNFNEWEDYDHQHPIKNHTRRHRKFIKFLTGYLKYHEKYEKKEVVEILRLRLSMFLYRDGIEASVIDRWLNRAINRGLKELDLRPTQKSMIINRMIETEKMYRLPWVAFTNNNPQSLARLNLEYVKIPDIKILKLLRDNKCLLPSLRTMSFLCVRFDAEALSSLLLQCPTITYLSLKECSFRDFKCCVSSSSLKFLELRHCIELQELHVHNETKNLESFTFISYEKPYSICEHVILNKSFKLKSIQIRASCGKFYDSYHLSWVTIFSHAKFLTSLKLHGTRLITHINRSANVEADDDRLLPSLKSLFFTSSWFADKTALSSFLSQCPSVEHLSIKHGHFENLECHVSSSSLKSLEVKYCKPLGVLRVDDQAKNLESLTFVSNTKGEKVLIQLNNAFNLKNIDICAHNLDEVYLNGYQRTLKGSMNVQNLHLFHGIYVQGHLCSLVRERWFVHYPSHFPRFIGCLKEFGYFKKITIYSQHLRALVIPNHYRKEFSSPLPKICTLEVRMPNPPTKTSKDYLDLMDSLQWMAPSASLNICKTETHRFALLEEETTSAPAATKEGEAMDLRQSEEERDQEAKRVEEAAAAEIKREKKREK